MMKDSKFWIWFIPLFIILSVGIYIMLNKNFQNTNYINNTNDTDYINKDAKLIKEEFEKLNDKGYYEVRLSENNAFKYYDLENIKSWLDENRIIFIGSSTDDNSRKAIKLIDEAVSSSSVKEVYYIDASKLTDDQKSVIVNKLDTYELVPNTYKLKLGTLITAKDKKLFNDLVYNKDITLEKYQEIIKDFIEKCDENC